MKYFLDTEFIEGFHKPLFGKRRHFIDMISISIVREDGKSYYAISNEFDVADADKWVVDNVISKLPMKLRKESISQFQKRTANVPYGAEWMDGKPNVQIRNEILDFFGCWRDQFFYRAPEGIEVYGYFADYDWVLLCSLFGRMIDLPKGFPMYCKDLKQMMDDKGLDGEWKRKNCPDPEGEHNALVDAEWNRKLFITLNRIVTAQGSDTRNL